MKLPRIKVRSKVETLAVRMADVNAVCRTLVTFNGMTFRYGKADLRALAKKAAEE